MPIGCCDQAMLAAVPASTTATSVAGSFFVRFASTAMIPAIGKTNGTDRTHTCALAITIDRGRNVEHHFEQGQQDRYDKQRRRARHKRPGWKNRTPAGRRE